MDLQRMKIDATFRDRKDRRGLKPRMNPSQESMEKMVALLYRAPRGGESEGLPVRAAAFGVEGTRRVSRPAGAGQPGSPGHPFPRARESSGPAPAKPVALLRSVRTPHAEVVRDASAVAGHRPGPSPGILRPRPGQAGSATPVCSYSSCRSGSGRLSRGGPSSGWLWLPSSCPNSCPNLSH